MQKFDPVKYPNLCALDEKVHKYLLTQDAKKLAREDPPRLEFEISRMHPLYWMEQYGKIRPGEVELSLGGEAHGGVIPFVLNAVQLHVADRICAHYLGEIMLRVQINILKHRKAGISTLIAAFDYWHMRFIRNMNAFVIADLSSHSDNIVEMIDTFHKHDTCGNGSKYDVARPPNRTAMRGNKKGLALSNSSMCEQDTGENSNPGTSQTINILHMSENSKWRDPSNAETSLLNSVPRRGYAFIVRESTAFGINKFARDCEESEAGKNAWEFVFITWLDMPDCEDPVYAQEKIEPSAEEKELMKVYPKMTLGHIKFRRRQIELIGNEDKFRQDFPLNSREPFLTSGTNFFNMSLIEERITTIKFYMDWKIGGIEAAYKKYPEIMVRVKHNSFGEREALSLLERSCVTPKLVLFTDNNGSVSCVADPKARMDSGAALLFREPRARAKYLLTIDVAEGKKQSDNSVIEVFDCVKREQCLEWCGQYDEEVTASYAVLIAKYFNMALIAPEMNNKCGGTLWGYIQGSRYRNVFYRDYIRGNKRERDPGWHTSIGTKKDTFNQMKLDFKNGDVLVHSVKLLEEMSYFIDAGGKLEAAEGHTDDRVSATAINLKIISITASLKATDAPLVAGYEEWEEASSHPRPSKDEVLRRFR